MRRKLILTALVSAFALGACGVKGDLKTPPPLWGDKKVEQPQTQDSDSSDTDPSG